MNPNTYRYFLDLPIIPTDTYGKLTEVMVGGWVKRRREKDSSPQV